MALGALGAGDALARPACTRILTLLVGAGAAAGATAAARAGAAALRAGTSVRAVAVVIVRVGRMTATAAISPSHHRLRSGVAQLWNAFIHPLSCNDTNGLRRRQLRRF